MWEVAALRAAVNDAQKRAAAGFKPKAKELLDFLATDPFQNVRVLRMWSHYK